MPIKESSTFSKVVELEPHHLIHLISYSVLVIDLKTSLTSVDAAEEVGPWLNKNNGKFTWHLKWTGCRGSRRKKKHVNYVSDMLERSTIMCIVLAASWRRWYHENLRGLQTWRMRVHVHYVDRDVSTRICVGVWDIIYLRSIRTDTIKKKRWILWRFVPRPLCR